MSDKPETLDAVLAEITEFCSGWSEDVDVTVKVGLIYGWMCRIKAAVEREREAYCDLCKEKDAAYDRLLLERDKAIKARAPGNAVALRDALTAFVDSIQWLCNGDERGIFKKQFAPLLSEARAALAAPPRNCDVGTAHEQYVRFEKHCNRKWKDYTNTDMRRPLPCGRNDRTNNPCARCFATWSQMPFAPAEGGAE